ncbi:MAG: endonuclease/exonuclease/phosphatase family protein, partial [Planctomycetota bacterium]
MNDLLRALGEGWQRVGSIYARYPVRRLPSPSGVTVARVEVGSRSVVVINCHWRPYPYGPYEVQERIRAGTLPGDPSKFAAEILRASDKVDGVKGRRETLEVVRSWRRRGETVVLTGDFNEPSHLDWTARAARDGLDRWVSNPSATPLRFAIPWRGSRELRALGLRDVYRDRFPNEVTHPGNTWTPRYEKEESDRREWGEQVLDRIDLVYVAGPGVKVIDAARVTEAGAGGEREVGEGWPSDHYAVWGELELTKSLPELRVFLMAGQSNMEGQGVVDLDHPEHYNGGRGTLARLLDDPELAPKLRHLRAKGDGWSARTNTSSRA